MRTVIIIVFICAIKSNFYTQCSVDAGNQLNVCFSDVGTNIVEAVANGDFPLSFKWSCDPVSYSSSLHFYASDFLDDTTILHPSILDPTITDSVVFFLEMIDNSGCIAKDSVLAIFSTFEQNLTYYQFSISKGDSIYLNLGSNLYGSITPVTYQWTPSESLSNPNNLSFWAKPDSSTSYFCTITDAIGCVYVGTPFYYITVNTLNLLENQFTKTHFNFNPISQQMEIQTNKSINQNLKLIDLSGKILFETFITEIYTVIDVSTIPKGCYIVTIGNTNGKFHLY